MLSVEDNLRGKTQYEYDPAHRIARVQSHQGASIHDSNYRFDSAGNLLEQPGLAGVTLLEGNRLLTANGDRFEYNPRNHIAVRESRSGSTDYFYDSRDMLVRCETAEGPWEAAYDPLGRRISKTFDDRKTEFFWDTDRLAAEISPDGKFRVYVYPDARALVPLLFLDYDSPEADSATGEAYFIFADHLGSPVRVENSRGDLAWEATYDPFGTAHIHPRSTIELNLRFPGHYFDRELGLHYNRFRYYSPELGRYVQSDPVGQSGRDQSPRIHEPTPSSWWTFVVRPVVGAAAIRATKMTPTPPKMAAIKKLLRCPRNWERFLRKRRSSGKAMIM